MRRSAHLRLVVLAHRRMCDAWGRLRPSPRTLPHRIVPKHPDGFRLGLSR